MSAAEATRGELAWLDGHPVPRADLAVPVGDAGFVLGVTVTEQLRTFRGRLFLPDDHARRLAESLAVVGLTPATTAAEIMAAASAIAAHNHALAAGSHPDEPGPDLGLVAFVTAGDAAAQHEGRGGPPRTMIHTFPLAFGMWAHAYDRGVTLRSVSVRQVPESCWPLHIKVRSRLHYFLADREAATLEPGARAVLAHDDGRISETSTANIAIVRDGLLETPPASDALGGVSLACTRRLADSLGICWRERSLTAADLAAADEILLTSTPSCLLPATRFDGRAVGAGVPGPIYRSLLDAWGRLVGLDIAGQARSMAAVAAAQGLAETPAS
ncbi:MAG: aminotransferase class IV [Pirellulales bacterium]